MSHYHQFKKQILEAIANGELTVEEVQELAADVSYVMYGKKPIIVKSQKVKAAAASTSV